MRTPARFLLFVVVLAMVALLLPGCGTQSPPAAGVAPNPTQPEPAQATTVVPPPATLLPPTATSLPPTATAVPPTATPIPPTATPVPPTATSAPPTATPVPPTATTAPATATSYAPAAAPKQDINLRGGPGTDYPVLGQAKAGQPMQIVGKNAAGTWWQVCCVGEKRAWLLAELVTVQGNVSGIAVATDIPTPAPQPAAAPAPPAGNLFGVLVFSVVNWDADRWEMKQYNFATGETKFLGEWRTMVAFSRDYKQFIYYGWPNVMGDRPGIYVAKPDMTGERLVIRGGAYPSLAPGGNRLSAQSGPNIYVLNSDGSGLRVLGPGEYPAWSPVDDWIAHRGCYGPDCGLWITHADRGERRRLTTGGGDGQPAWSPDGKQLVYISKDDGNFEIYRINRDGSGKMRLTNEMHRDRKSVV